MEQNSQCQKERQKKMGKKKKENNPTTYDADYALLGATMEQTSWAGIWQWYLRAGAPAAFRRPENPSTDAVYMDLYIQERRVHLEPLISAEVLLRLQWNQALVSRNLNMFCRPTSFPGVEKLVLSYRYFTEFVIGYNQLLQQWNSYELQ